MEFEKLQEIIADVLNVNADEITMETKFVDDLGADSLDIFQIIMGIEEAFDIEIDNDDAEKIVTVGDAVEQIKNATNEAERRKSPDAGFFFYEGLYESEIKRTGGTDRIHLSGSQTAPKGHDAQLLCERKASAQVRVQ